MKVAGESYEAMAFVNYDEHDRLTVATFMWEYAQPDHTYTVAPDSSLSFELDAQFVGRLSRIVLYDVGKENSKETLESVVGKDMTESIYSAPAMGINIARGILTERNRAALVAIQDASPSTPPLLRRAARMQLHALQEKAASAEVAAAA